MHCLLETWTAERKLKIATESVNREGTPAAHHLIIASEPGNS